MLRIGQARLLVLVCIGLALAGMAHSARSAPEDAGTAPAGAVEAPDPMLALLIERGLLPSFTVDLMQGMRDGASNLVVSALNFLGVPYKWGGNNADEGFDCSGFTRYVFETSLGRVLPRRADEQAKDADLLAVAREDLKPGDLVFFNTLRRTFSHVGIYVGDGKFIHAPRTGAKVRVEDMRADYWARRFTGARRANVSLADAGDVASATAP